jgi:hypothetical protein
VNYILLARGGSLETARVLAVSADQTLIHKFVAELVSKSEESTEASEPIEHKPLRVVPGGEE